MSAQQQFTIKFKAGDVKSLNLKDISARRFVRMYDNSRGVLQGTINTGTAWDAKDRPKSADVALVECGLELFDPELEQAWFFRPFFFLLGVIEYEIDGKVGYLARVREMNDDSDAAQMNQYEDVMETEDPRDWRTISKAASVAHALDQYLFCDDRHEQAARIAEPTLAEYTDEAITWEDPGPAVNNHGAWQEDADQLRAHPGQWAVIAVYGEDRGRDRASYLSATIRNGGLPAFRPKGSFEAAVRTQPDGTLRVHARYVG